VAGIEATCTGSGCQTTAVVFTRPISCPVKAGKTCTLYLHVEGQAYVSAKDNGLFRFLIDGLAPVSGPTDKNGYFSWDAFDANSALSIARSYAVVGKVTNSSDNQLHPIEVDIGCEDETGDGCTAIMGFASMSTGVFTP
jgi:hypothetical protein